MLKIIIGALVALAGIIGVGVYSGVQSPISFSDDSHERRDMDEVIVYETDAESAEDCTSVETFDPERMVCSFECTSDAQCEDIQSQIDNELDQLGDEYVDSSKDFAEPERGEKQEGITAEYTVNSNETIALVSGEDSQQAQDAWDLFAKISPNDFSARYLEKYEVSNNPKDDTIAYVHDEDGNGKWAVGVNFGTYGVDGKREDILSMIHEFSHILTLNTTQVDSQITDGCVTYNTGDGCARENSYIQGFVAQFWSSDEIAQSEKDGSELYAQKQDSFVTEYAATSPSEDISESFALFVLEKKPESSGTVAQSKMSYFYAYPELVVLRDSIRKEVGSVVMARKRMQN